MRKLMPPEDIAQFNWLEAAARIYMVKTKNHTVHGVLPFKLNPGTSMEIQAYRVRYRQGNNFITGYFWKDSIAFRQMGSVRNIKVVLLSKVEAYLETRDIDSPPPLLIPYLTKPSSLWAALKPTLKLS